MTDITPTQEDRDAAADYSFKHENPVWWLPEAIREGQKDEAPLAQAFARHRQAERERCAAICADYAARWGKKWREDENEGAVKDKHSHSRLAGLSDGASTLEKVIRNQT